MNGQSVNPFGMAINLVIGWFVISFLQAALRSMISAAGPGLWAGFLDIALLRNGAAALINLVAILVLGGIGTTIWFLAKK
jgi:hypothetical protein